MKAQNQTKHDACFSYNGRSTDRNIGVAGERGTNSYSHRTLITIILVMVRLCVAVKIKHVPSGAAIMSNSPRGAISWVKGRKAVEARIHSDLPGIARRISRSGGTCRDRS